MTYLQLKELQADLEQQLMIADSMSERHRVDVELEQVESALADMEEVN